MWHCAGVIGLFPVCTSATQWNLATCTGQIQSHSSAKKSLSTSVTIPTHPCGAVLTADRQAGGVTLRNGRRPVVKRFKTQVGPADAYTVQRWVPASRGPSVIAETASGDERMNDRQNEPTPTPQLRCQLVRSTQNWCTGRGNWKQTSGHPSVYFITTVWCSVEHELTTCRLFHVINLFILHRVITGELWKAWLYSLSLIPSVGQYNNNNNNNNSTVATSYVSQNALQAESAAAAASARKTTKYSTLSASHMFVLSGGCRDSWSLVRRGSRPHCRNWQKTHALHSRLAGNYVCVPMYFCGNSAFQRSVPCQHVHSLRVPIVTIPDIHFCIY